MNIAYLLSQTNPLYDHRELKMQCIEERVLISEKKLKKFTVGRIGTLDLG